MNKDTIFQQDTIFRLVDIEGVYLGSAGDSIVINEPNDFADRVRFTLKRERGFHGVNYEFTDSESQIAFDNYSHPTESISGRHLLNEIYKERGVMGRALLQFEVNGVIEINSRILFKGRKVRLKEDIYRSKTTYFNDDFFNNEDIPFDLNSSENLNQEPYSPPIFNDMVLTPQAITKKASLSKDPGDNIFEGIESTLGMLNLGRVLENNFQPGPITYNTQLINNINQFPLQVVQDFGYYFFDVKELTYQVRCTDSCSLNLNVAVYDPINDEIVESDTLNAATYGPLDVGNIITISITDANSEEIFANKDMLIIVWLEVIRVNFAQIDYLNTVSSSSLLTGKTKGIFLNTKYVEINEGISKLTEGITGVNNAVDSPFLNQQKAALLSGRLTRGFPESSPFYMRLDEALNSLRSIFGLGYSITEESGSEKINIGIPSDFYKNVEIDYIDNAHEYEETPDDLSLWSKLELGYKNYSEGTNTVLLNDSIKDFLTRHEYKTPVNVSKNTFTRVSDWICSGYLIEEGKQQNFSNFPDESWRHDDDTFLIAINEGQNTMFDQVIDFTVDFFGNILIVIHQAAPAEVINAGVVEILFSGSPFLGPFPIDSVRIERDINRTFINTTILGTDIGFLPHVDLVFSGVSWIAPEGGESFEVINGVDDPNAVYNARYNIKNMMLANSLVLNSGFTFENSSSEFILSKFINNASLETQFKVGENFSTLDPDRIRIIQSENISLALVNQNNKIYIAELCNFKAQIGYDRIFDIKNAYTNRLPGKNYGFIRVLDPVSNTDKKWFLLEMSHNSLDNEMNFLGLRKHE